MNLNYPKRPNNHDMYVANLDSDIVSVIGTDNLMATAPQAVCSDENVKIGTKNCNLHLSDNK